MAQFLRPAEAKLILALTADSDVLLEELVAQSGLAPSDANSAIQSLHRRRLVTSGSRGYRLTAEGVNAKATSSPARDPSRGYGPVFLLGDNIEQTMNATSQADLSRALDSALGTPPQESATDGSGSSD